MNQSMAVNNREQLGFTLIELSIVLVIIGLIVGGVLVGQDLIKAAEIRATVSQYEKYNSEVNTFRNKYNGIPGDIACATAWTLGFTAGQSASCTTGMTGALGGGDGNGMLQALGGTAGAASEDYSMGEPLVFWKDLSDANLIDGNYGQNLTTAAKAAADLTSAALLQTYIPPAKVGRGNYWMVGASNGINYYLLTGFNTASTPIAAATGIPAWAGNLTPIESYNIDIKVDDGLPNTGIIQARGTDATAFQTLTGTNAPANWNANSNSTNCVMGGSNSTDPADIYNRNLATGGNTPLCALRLRFN